jgi:methyl-accepting chemotaxis protein
VLVQHLFGRQDARSSSSLSSSALSSSALSSSAARAVLESVQSNIFVADLDLRLMYANRRALRTAAAFADQLRSSFGLDVDDLIGGSIHRFHRDPARIEKLLHDPRSLPHQASFRFGDVTLTTTIAPVVDDAGRVSGYCVAWDDVSAQRRLEDEVRRVAEQLSSSGDLLGDLSGKLSADAVATAGQVGTAAAATEEMSVSIQDIASTTGAAAALAAESVVAAGSASQRIDQLSASAAEIGGVVQLITKIAQQTNLLALNATIEAARAGEVGRGFAVVATEVKELARETAEATERITGMIEELRGDTSRATDAINAITTLIDRINTGQDAIADALRQQSSATDDINRVVSHVAGNASQATEALGALSTDATEMRATVHQLRRLLADLQG